LLVVPVLLTQAQRLEKAKDLLGKKDKLADARTEIDKVLAIEKNQQNPEAWLVKSKIYLKIAADQELKNYGS
jgi:hypothetical protein